MTLPFQCTHDQYGDIHVAAGRVTQLSSGVSILVGAAAADSGLVPSTDMGRTRVFPSATFSINVGGSGRGLIDAAGTSTIAAFVGNFYIPSKSYDQLWERTGFAITTSGGYYSISDATDVIAIMEYPGSSPLGYYISTTYGATTYNSSTGFSILIAAEVTGGGAWPSTAVTVNAGTAQTGSFTTTDGLTWTSATDADWTIVVASDGTAEMCDTTTVIATREIGAPGDPSGFYDATAAGMAAHNLTAAEPVTGEPWTACVQVLTRAPREGFVYVKVLTTDGTLTSAEGPFFATETPTGSTGVSYVQIASVSAAGAIAQDHAGTILWPS